MQGIYPLPTTFPVLKEGNQNISIKAGIKNNGISATRVNYPFYDFYTENIILKKDSTTIINPAVSYFENTSFYIIDFENGSSTFIRTENSDTSFLVNNDTTIGSVFEGVSGGVHLESPESVFEVTTEELQYLTSSFLYSINYNIN